MHYIIRIKLLSCRIDKLVYLYCNNRLIKKLESDDYNEEVLKWIYNVTDEEEEDNLEELGNPMQVCSTLEIEENL